MESKKTIPEKILEVLSQVSMPLATFEFPLKQIGTNECTVSARLRQLAQKGKVIGFTRKDKRYKEWILVGK